MSYNHSPISSTFMAKIHKEPRTAAGQASPLGWLFFHGSMAHELNQTSLWEKYNDIDKLYTLVDNITTNKYILHPIHVVDSEIQVNG